MNLPNKLTLFRVILVPFFVFFILFSPDDITFRIIAEGIFIVASLTDMLDGKIARKYNLITNFGKFMDPLADKLLVCSALICFIETKQIAAWIVIIIIAREFIISGVRLIAAEQGIVIAASIWGKLKTVSQMVTVIVLILNLSYFLPGGAGTVMSYVETALIYISLILTIVSLLDYLIKNKGVFRSVGEDSHE